MSVSRAFIVLCVAVCGLAGTMAVPSPLRAETIPPNIIVVNLDDIGPAWFPPYARRIQTSDVETKICNEYASIRKNQGVFDLAKHIDAAAHSTPFLDGLARDGMVFNRCFSTSSFCSPSRSGLLTGRYQQSWGGYSIPDVYRIGIPAEAPVVAEVLKGAGYTCAMIGKWHVAPHDQRLWKQATGQGHEKQEAARALGFETSSTPGQNPLDRGFDYYFGYNNHASKYYGADDLWEGRERVPKRPDDEFLTDLFNGKCAAFVQQQVEKKQKFFLYYAPMAVHGALEPPPEKYTSQFHTGIAFSDQYAGHLLAVDEGVKKIYEILAAHEQDKNTLLFLTADNGQSFYRVPPYNAPYRGGKGTGWLGGSHEPLIVSWPAQVHAGFKEEIVSTMDISATALDAAGLTPPKPMDGRSLLPLMLGQSKAGPHDEIFGAGRHSASASDPYFPGSSGNERRTMANGGENDDGECPLFAWRLNEESVLMYISKTLPGLYTALPDGRPAQKLFFKLKDDPTESKNVYDDASEEVRKANAELKRWLETTRPPLFKHESDYNELHAMSEAAAAPP